MAVKNISIRLVAYSDAAGKYEAGAPLNGNEDNFFVDDDLSDDFSGPTRVDTPVKLSDYGCLMAVADGMGGQNAGEVASEIAVETIAEFFKADKITPKIAATPQSRAEYIKQCIIEADRRVKAGTEDHPERAGMGSTIIISWIKGTDLTVGWLGDSRCYRYNPRRGLEPVSRDHTYVQELADKGIISYEDTFSHPQGNIVTRSLGDPDATPPVPEAVNVRLFKGDVILMCSDGLSGVLPDEPMRDVSDSLRSIIEDNYGDLTKMRAALMEAAERQQWYDNVTVLLLSIDGDLGTAPHRKKVKPAAAPATAPISSDTTAAAPTSRNRLVRRLSLVLVIALVAVAALSTLKFMFGDDSNGFYASPIDAAEEYESSAPESDTTSITAIVAETDTAATSAVPQTGQDSTVVETDTPPQPVDQQAESSDWKAELIGKIDTAVANVKNKKDFTDIANSLRTSIQDAPDENMNDLAKKVDDFTIRANCYTDLVKLHNSCEENEQVKTLMRDIMEIGIEDLQRQVKWLKDNQICK